MPSRADEAKPSPVEIRVAVEPQTVNIGTRFRYTVEVEAAADVEVVVAQPAERIGDFEIVDFGIAPPVERNGRRVVTRWYTLVGYSPGERMIPSPPVHYRLPGDALTEVPGREIRVSVESLLAKTPEATDLRDIKGPEAVPRDPRPYYLLAGAGALVLAVAAGLSLLRRRRRTVDAAPPPRPAHEVAAEALDVLRARGLVAAGAFKEYYSSLSDIVRAYLEQAFALRAPEMTTEEFLLASARGGRLLGPHRALLAEFLRESDLVKFARHLPTAADGERAWAAARRFVAETAAAPAPEEQRAAG